MVSVTTGDALCLRISCQGVKWVLAMSYGIISFFFIIFFPPNNLCGVQSSVLSGTGGTSILRAYKPLNRVSLSLPWDASGSLFMCGLAFAVCG